MPVLFCKQQYKSNTENTEWKIAVVVFFKSMIQRINAYYKSNDYHEIFKVNIINNIDAK